MKYPEKGTKLAPPPRHTFRAALGIAKGKTPPPDDATVKKWIEEHRQQKYG
jgi:hypothetical protein